MIVVDLTSAQTFARISKPCKRCWWKDTLRSWWQNASTTRRRNARTYVCPPSGTNSQSVWQCYSSSLWGTSTINLELWNATVNTVWLSNTSPTPSLSSIIETPCTSRYSTGSTTQFNFRLGKFGMDVICMVFI